VSCEDCGCGGRPSCFNVDSQYPLRCVANVAPGLFTTPGEILHRDVRQLQSFEGCLKEPDRTATTTAPRDILISSIARRCIKSSALLEEPVPIPFARDCSAPFRVTKYSWPTVLHMHICIIIHSTTVSRVIILQNLLIYRHVRDAYNVYMLVPNH